MDFIKNKKVYEKSQFFNKNKVATLLIWESEADFDKQTKWLFFDRLFPTKFAKKIRIQLLWTK